MMSKNTISFHPAITGEFNSPLNLNFNEAFVPQVKKFIEGLPDLRNYGQVAMIGQATAAIASLPMIEMIAGLPTITLISGFGADAAPVGKLDLAKYRHEQVRPLRDKRPEGDQSFDGYTVINGGHQMTPSQIDQLVEKLGEKVRVINVPVGQIDYAHPEAGVAEALLETELTVSDWESGKILYNPAGFGTAAVVQATAIYALSGRWPLTIRLNRGVDGSFNVDEIIDIQALRHVGSDIREALDKAGAPVVVPAEIFSEILSALSGTELAERLQQLKS